MSGIPLWGYAAAAVALTGGVYVYRRKKIKQCYSTQFGRHMQQAMAQGMGPRAATAAADARSKEACGDPSKPLGVI